MLGSYLKGVIVDLDVHECVVRSRNVTIQVLKVVKTTCYCHIVHKYDLRV